MKVSALVERWVNAGVIDNATAARIMQFESTRGGLNFGNALFGLGGLAIFLGIAAIIGVNWASIPASIKIGIHTLINGGAGFALYRLVGQNKHPVVQQWLTGLLAGLTLTFIALVGQIYQTQEPAWKALAFWLLITTPFWLALARTRTLVQLWIGAFLATYFAYIAEHTDTFQSVVMMTSLLPFGMIAAGQHIRLRMLRPLTLQQISYTGFALIVVGSSMAQFFWRDGSMMRPTAVENAILWRTFFVTMIAAVALAVMRRRKMLIDMPSILDLLLVVSVIISFAPILLPHGHWAVFGAIVVMAYWALCGWAGFQAGYPRALELATTLIALRLVIVYIEVFGSLLQTGVGLIVSGVLMIALVWGTRKLLARLRLARSLTTPGGQP